MATKLTYKDAGLDLDLYNQTISRIAPLLRRTFSPRVIERKNAFAGLFTLDFPQRLFRKNYRNPVLVSGTDGVGTKLKIAMMMRKHDTVGIDLVAMCANDCLCAGAELLFFLDYLAMGKDDPDLTEQLVMGITDGCRQAGCALIGGETAIMPDFYAAGEYDMAGFCVGVVERRRLIDSNLASPGDVLLGIASSGLHSNGYSLARKVVFEQAGLGIEDHIPDLGMTVGQALLQPTRIYAKAVHEVLKRYRVKRIVRGIAHITGGGLLENVPRALSPGCHAVIQRSAWTVPPLFRWLQRLGDIPQAEMDRVFNQGIGLVLIVRPHYADCIARNLAEAGYENWFIGELCAGEPGVAWTG